MLSVLLLLAPALHFWGRHLLLDLLLALKFELLLALSPHLLLLHRLCLLLAGSALRFRLLLLQRLRLLLAGSPLPLRLLLAHRVALCFHLLLAPSGV